MPVFNRPSVSLDAHGKSWQNVNVESLTIGDNVKDHGVLSGVVMRGTEEIQLIFADGRSQWFKLGTTIHAFTKGA